MPAVVVRILDENSRKYEVRKTKTGEVFEIGEADIEPLPYTMH